MNCSEGYDVGIPEYRDVAPNASCQSKSSEGFIVEAGSVVKSPTSCWLIESCKVSIPRKRC